MLLTFNFFLAILIFCFRCLKEFQFSPDVRCSWCQMSFYVFAGLISSVMTVWCCCFSLEVIFFASMPTFWRKRLFWFSAPRTSLLWISFWCDAFRIFDDFPCLFVAIYWVCLRYNDLLQDFSVQVRWLVRLFAFSTVAIYPSPRDYSYVIKTDAL